MRFLSLINASATRMPAYVPASISQQHYLHLKQRRAAQHVCSEARGKCGCECVSECVMSYHRSSQANAALRHYWEYLWFWSRLANRVRATFIVSTIYTETNNSDWRVRFSFTFQTSLDIICIIFLSEYNENEFSICEVTRNQIFPG